IDQPSLQPMTKLPNLFLIYKLMNIEDRPSVSGRDDAPCVHHLLNFIHLRIAMLLASLFTASYRSNDHSPQNMSEGGGKVFRGYYEKGMEMTEEGKVLSNSTQEVTTDLMGNASVPYLLIITNSTSDADGPVMVQREQRGSTGLQ
ncbi:hypothetical protein L9F63_013425, partial [Diploptera punctata]